MRFALLIVTIVSCLAPVVTPTAADSSWERRLSLPAGDIYDIAFATKDVAWSVGPGGVFRTEDGGRSWAIASSPNVEPLYNTAAAPDGLHGWAVGASGNIAATKDGGRTWGTQSSGTDVNLSFVAAIDDQTALAGGWGVGFSDVIIEPQPFVLLRTTDAGATWRQFTVDGNYRPQGMDALGDGKHAWIAGRRCGAPVAGGRSCPYEDALLRSDDGGHSWSVVNTSNSFLRIEFVAARAGWGLLSNCDENFACTQGVARTIDGGTSWKTVRSPSPGMSFASLNAFDAKTAVVYEQGCPDNVCATRALTTHDAGTTWTNADAGLKPGQFVGTTAFVDETHGIRAVGEPQWTSDGRTWHTAAFPVVLGSGDFDFVDPMTGWIAASKLLRTSDAGATWAAVSDRTFSSVDFATSSAGLAIEFSCSSAGCPGAVWRSTDGGATWTDPLALGDLGDAPQVVFADASNGWVFAPYDGKSFHTTDGGISWRQQALSANGQSGRRPEVAFVDGRTGWVAAQSCEPGLANCQILTWRTDDGGETFAPLTSIDDDGGCGPRGLAAIDADHAWIAGLECRDYSRPFISATSDGGATWQSHSLGYVGEFRPPTFFDALTGRSLGAVCPSPTYVDCIDTLFRTSDGGATWNQEPTGLAVAFGGGKQQFLTPELAWRVTGQQGGIVGPFRNELYRYDSNRPFIINPRRQPEHAIVPPDAGTGASAPGHDVTSLFRWLLLAGTASLVTGGALRWRHAQ